ncbi:peptidoglycan DD-metalloendopeptidase family protein [Jannaschia sp. LMIT008]|uniref:peptidoglycan DD-metalloendopeptidase family protein n=1 Tax=Jannaschia maritima TaxID=3032585 RepID=UPI0028116C8B|nr:peptidoglycan DD-metalloendopeptidase family protein [Jannaschia sp. LMIT008]
MTERTYRRAGRVAVLGCGALLLAACADGLDVDLREGLPGGLDTTDAALGATADRPTPDARGLITYPNYQVAVARRGDTVADVAGRIGVDAAQLARFNGLAADAGLNAGAVLALQSRAGAAGGGRDIASIAGAAIDRASGAAPGTATASGPEPVRHRVARGETAFSIARLYGVTPRALADWNGLGADLAVREGQFLLIPLVLPGTTAGVVDASVEPGRGTATPVPPSASSALPETIQAEALPPSPNLDQFRTDAAPPPPPEAAPAAPARSEAASGGIRLRAPVSGSIRRGYSASNEGLDYAAGAGAAVSAAADGTVAAITRDTDQVPILVLRHDGGLLTVYANIDQIVVSKGDSVRAGQRIASVGPGEPPFLHFELRRGLDPIDPTPFLR